MSRAGLLVALGFLLPVPVHADPPTARTAADLDAIEQRLPGYDAAAAQEQVQCISEIEKQIDGEKDPAKRNQLLSAQLGNLMSARRYRRLAALCRHILSDSKRPPAPGIGLPALDEQAAYFLLVALGQYSAWDGILKEGEAFLAKYPASPYFTAMRLMVDKALIEKRLILDGALAAKKDIAELSPEQRGNPCTIVAIYTRSRQWPEARRALESMKPGQCPLVSDELQGYLIGMATGDFKLVRQALQRIKEKDPSLYNSYRSLEMTLPAD